MSEGVPEPLTILGPKANGVFLANILIVNPLLPLSMQTSWQRFHAFRWFEGFHVRQAIR